MTFAVAVDVLVLAWLLWRQLKVRRVWPRLTLRLAAVLGVIGLFELFDYAGAHHVSAEAVGILTLSFLVGGVALGAVRAATVRIWRIGPAVVRQGTWLTVGLWGVSLALHYGAAAWIDSINGQGGVVSASLLLWLAITYGVQNAVVHHRAVGLLEAAGPIDARSEVAAGRWGAGRWVGWDGDELFGPGPRGAAPARREAIEARAEPADTGGQPHGGEGVPEADPGDGGGSASGPA